MSVLDLSGADLKGFDPVPSGVYAATVYDAEWKETKGGENAKLPAGTAMLSVQFKIDDVTIDGTEYKNRRVFGQYPLPGADAIAAGYDADKADKLKGSFVKMLVAIGYDEKKVMGGKFNLDIEDMKGRECTVVVGRQEYPPNSGEFNNTLKGVKPAGSGTGADKRGII